MNESASRWDGTENELMMADRQPISAAAIVAGITGVLAGLSYAVPGLAVLLLVSLLAAVVAVLSHSRSPRALVWLAYVGVAIGMTGVVWSLTTRSFYQNHLVATGEKYAEQWLEILRDGKLEEAICLRMDYWDRPLESVQLVNYFQQTERTPGASDSTPPPAQMKDEFLMSNTVQNLLESGPQTRIRLQEDRTRFFEQAGSVEVEGFFEIELLAKDPRGNMRRKTQIVSVAVKRIQYPKSAHWQVSRVHNHSQPDMPVETASGEGENPEGENLFDLLPPIEDIE
jgi:hypothetical protein